MKKIALFLTVLFLSGCAEGIFPGENVTESEEKISDTADTKEAGSALDTETAAVSTGRVSGAEISENRDFFAGADITGDSNVEGIADFEEKTWPHEVYAEEVYIDEPQRAAAFMLEAYSMGRTPYIILKNRDSINNEDFEKCAEKFAEAIGTYQVEVMIEILENSYYYDENGERYAALAEMIKENNPGAVTVWSVKWDDIILVNSCMPGENVDYICINGYFSSCREAERMFSEVRDHLNTDKRVIFRFGAAAYSTDDCAYTQDEALKTIELVYETVKKDAGAAGIIYMDKNTKLSDKVRFTDYSVTSDKKLTEGYKSILEDAADYREEKEMTQ